MLVEDGRRLLISNRLLPLFRGVMPRISETEREALDAGISQIRPGGRLSDIGAAVAERRARALGKSGMPISGMLTSVSDFRILARAQAGKLLRVEVRELRRLGMMMMVSGTVSVEGQTVASGELTLYG